MNTSGWFSLHREIFLKFEGKSPDLFKFWVWIISQANFNVAHDLKPGQFYTTMSELRGALMINAGTGQRLPSRRKINRYISELVNSERMTHRMTQLYGQPKHLITVLNYSDYQGVKRVSDTLGDTVDAPKGGTTPIIYNKKNNCRRTPLDEFRRDVKMPILKVLTDHADRETMPKEFRSWFIKKTMSAGGFPKELSEKKAQPQFESFVAHSKSVNRKCNDWYHAWRDSVLKYLRTEWLGPKDLSEYQANYNHGWEESHKGKFDGSQLPPEIGSVPDHWEPKLSSR